MSKLDVMRALSSDVRLEILKLLYQKPRDIEDLATNHLKLQPITVRHHIQYLQEAGLLESYEERTGSAGRPKTYYKVAKGIPAIVFPARRYYDFSKSMLTSLVNNLGEEKTGEVLKKIGEDMGKETAKYLAAVYNIKEWKAKEFADIFVQKYLQESGSEPEIIERDDNRVTYRIHNCLLYELSQETPSLMCDAMHCNFNEALVKAMSANFKDSQTKCMGHGDAYCEHTVEWIPKEKKTSKKN